MREIGHRRIFGRGVVVKQVDRCAGRGHEAHARAFRQPACLKRERRLDEIVKRAATDDAVALAHRDIGGIVAGNRAGMGLRGRARLQRCTGLDRDDRLAHCKCAASRMHERLRPADAFDEQHDRVRVGIVDEKIEVVGEAQIRLVTRGDAVGVPQPAVGRCFHEELEQAARLEDAGNRARRKPAQIGIGIREHALAIGISAHAVRPGHAQAAVCDEIFQPSAALVRLRRVAIADHRGINRGGLDAARLGVGEDVGHRRGRHDHQRMVDGLRQLAQRGKAPLAKDACLARIDERDRSGITELAQVVKNFGWPARAFGRAHDRERGGPERAHRRAEQIRIGLCRSRLRSVPLPCLHGLFLGFPDKSVKDEPIRPRESP